jgi:pantoate--beta-alanine ligase
MVLLHSLEALRDWQLKSGWSGLKGGFVPTMGALHQGHASLIQRAGQACDLVLVSVLVNPTQFNEAADFEAYPRTLDEDAAKAGAAGAAAVFAPSAEELYGGIPSAPHVNWGPLTHAYEGAHRPGHFDGVVAVVDLLFAAVRPKVAVFGEKDLQQVAVVKRLAAERHPGLEIQVGELVRDAAGLALSSRNARLDETGKNNALALYRALSSLRDALGSGLPFDEALASERRKLAESPGISLEYLDVVNADTFEPATSADRGPLHGVVAAHVQGVRLIDNLALRT